MPGRPGEGAVLIDRAYLVVRMAEWLGMHAPRNVALPAAERFLESTFDRSAARRAVLTGNLGRVLDHPPESPLVRRAARECLRLYGRYWYETFALRTMPPEEVDRRFSLDGLDHIDRALKDGRGIVLALPHMGNWDAAGHWMALHGYRLTAVAEELKPRSVFELFLRHRRALGIGIVSLPVDGEGGGDPPPGAGPRAGERLVQLLSENEVITLVADRDLTGRGVDVEMFGAMRKLPAGPAYLALATGAPLCPAAVFTTDEGWHTVIGPPLEIDRTGHMRTDVTAMTKVMAERFERSIAASPADWHMLQPAWADIGGSGRGTVDRAGG